MHQTICLIRKMYDVFLTEYESSEEISLERIPVSNNKEVTIKHKRPIGDATFNSEEDLENVSAAAMLKILQHEGDALYLHLQRESIPKF